MRTTRKMFTVVAATTLSLTATAAMADVVYNDLDDSVDTTAETMTLQYDATPPGTAGPSMTTKLAIDVDGKFVGNTPDHNNCNLQGGAQYIVLKAVTTPSSVVHLSFPDGLRFDTCQDTRRVVVSPTAVGHTTVSFVIDTSKTPRDPRAHFDLETAAFVVDVEEADLSSDGGTGTKCDKNPAAPAWAAALLQANGLRPRAHDGTNYVRQVADQMGKRASFPDGAGAMVAKDANRAYANAVYNYLTSERGMGLSLENGVTEIKRPGWTCSSVS